MSNASERALYIVGESVYNTTPATPAFLAIRNNGGGPVLSKDTFESEEIRPDRAVSDVRHGARKVSGEVAVDISYDPNLQVILQAVLGGTWTNDVLKMGKTRRSFTMESVFTDLAQASEPYHRFTGIEFDKLSMQISANKMVTGSVGLVGCDLGLAGTPITDSTYGSLGVLSPFDSFSGEIREGGTESLIITELSFSLENGLTPRYAIGSDKTLRPSWGKSRITGSVSMFHEDSDLLLKFINETESELSFDLVDKAGNKLTFAFGRIKYTGGTIDVKGDGPNILVMPFTGLYDTGDSSNVVITRDPVT